jgi:alpha-L-rhamnosidase
MSTAIERISIDAPYGSDVVADARPAIGWVTRSEADGWRQARAELELRLGDGVQTHVVEGRDSVRVPWPFAPLAPREEAELRVRVTGTDGAASDWSAPRRIVAGFLADGEWTAPTVAVAAPEAPAEPAVLRREFAVDGEVRRATLYATAVGVYQAAINGADVDDQVMKPGWTPFQARTVHETTDVTALLAQGANAIALRVAGAWATERFGFRENAKPVYAEQPRVAAQLVIEYADGRSETVVTDADWASVPGPITASGLYAGEHHDARRALVDDAGRTPSEAGFDAAGWAPVAVVDDVPAPGARVSPFVRRTEEIAVADVITTPSGRTVLDFGQNLVGRLRIRVGGPAGAVVTLRHAEVLEHGELGTRPLRAAEATDSYTLAGTGVEVWEPEFTFHGFRYAEIEGWPGALDPADVTAVVVHSDMERTGWFDTSEPLVRQLHENVVWGLRGNFLSVPTDCPQRDERLGWTGDIEVFAPTASFLYDVRGFLDSWLRDLEIEQVDGVVPFVVPNVLGPAAPAAAWGDAATVVPSVLYERHDDLGALGLDAARRLHQPRRDDLVQPLRARRHRRLAAPLRRGPRSRGAWLRAPADRATPPRRLRLRLGGAPDAVRPREGPLGARGRRDRRRGARSGQRRGRRRAAGRVAPRGRLGHASVDGGGSRAADRDRPAPWPGALEGLITP